ncbi:MAG: cytochrome c [Alphaproteobacteria bacterium]|nr:cytochrome c [Alphaproteobacteria bacterium]
MRRDSSWSEATLIAFLLLGGAAAADEPPPALRQRELRHLLDHDCGSCHGLTRRGGLGPALSASALADRDDDFLIDTILFGRRGTPMPPWATELSRVDARFLVEMLRGR